MCDACRKQIADLREQQRQLWAEQFKASTALKSTDRDIAAYGRALALIQVQVSVLEQAERRHQNMIAVRDANVEPVPTKRPNVDPLTDLERGVGL